MTTVAKIDHTTASIEKLTIELFEGGSLGGHTTLDGLQEGNFLLRRYAHENGISPNDYLRTIGGICHSEWKSIGEFKRELLDQLVDAVRREADALYKAGKCPRGYQPSGLMQEILQHRPAAAHSAG